MAWKRRWTVRVLAMMMVLGFTAAPQAVANHGDEQCVVNIDDAEPDFVCYTVDLGDKEFRKVVHEEVDTVEEEDPIQYLGRVELEICFDNDDDPDPFCVVNVPAVGISDSENVCEPYNSISSSDDGPELWIESCTIVVDPTPVRPVEIGNPEQVVVERCSQTATISVNTEEHGGGPGVENLDLDVPCQR